MSVPIRRRSGSRRGTARIAVLVSGTVLATLLQAVPETPAIANSQAPAARSHERPVKGTSSTAVKGRKTAVPAPPPKPKISWPEKASATAVLSAAPSSAEAALPLRGGKMPVLLSAAPAGARVEFARPAAGAPARTAAPYAPPAAVKVDVLDRTAAKKAGVDGVLLAVGRTDTGALESEVDVALDYSGFARAGGAGYGERLRLVQMPACALTTPAKPECRTQAPLDSTNDAESRRVGVKGLTLPAGSSGGTRAAAKSAAGVGGALVLAAAPAASGPSGDFTATPMAASGRWSTDLNGGSFAWSYDIGVPPVPGDLKPGIGLSYSSASIDGRSANSNNQSSWAGDGFAMGQGFVERAYKPCADDGVENNGIKPGDLCWAYDNATISFDGHSGELIPVAADEWRIQGDDGTKVTRVRDSARGNGDDDGEYFKAVTPDGTQYYFGYNRLPNWASGKPETKSVYTVPVFGDDAKEPCHAATFAASWCQQGWRWNLDLVVDTKGNDITYWYKPELNSYGRNMKAADDTPYTRGGTLERIEYGQQQSDIHSATVKPMARVSFGTAGRCLESGTVCDFAKIDANRQYWYDTPWDRNCKAGTDCDKGRFSPTFFTTTRLETITAQTLQADGSYKDTDRWELDHHWGTADSDYQLLLSSVQHTGLAATTPVAIPKTTFSYTPMPNRLDKDGDGRLPFHKKRLTTIADEYGGQIDANYSAPACSWSNLPAPEDNTTRCFPVKYQPIDTQPVTNEWFNKYVVDTVIATDRTGGAPDTMTKYTYVGGAAWHFDDDDGLTREKLKTWSQWRGYAHTRVETGSNQAFVSQEDHYFLRGMDGDRSDPADKARKRSVSVNDGEGTTLVDDEAWRGFEYRTEEYDAPGGRILQKEVKTPWKKQTAERVRDWGTSAANITNVETTRSFVSLDKGAGSAWREVKVNTPSFDGRGRATASEELGDVSTTADDKCTRTTYADNATAGIYSAPVRVETVAGNCAKAVNRVTRADGTSDVLSDVRTRYDGQGNGAAPTKGLATMTSVLKTRSATQAVYLDNTTAYDVYGRPLKVTGLASTSTYNAADESAAPTTTAHPQAHVSTTVYTPATGRPTSMKSTTPPATVGVASTAQTTTTTFDLGRALPVSVVDTTGRRTDIEYDALGRTRKVWQPNRSKVNGQSPNAEYRYSTAEGGIASVASLSLNNDGSQDTEYTLYDGFVRPRQTQKRAADGGMVLTDTFYDAMGRSALTYAPYYARKAPSGVLFKVEDATGVETQTAVEYDAMGRPTKSTLLKGNGVGVPLAVTRTEYSGDRVSVTPPRGGVATTTLSDAFGRTTEVRTHKEATPTGPYDATRYQYSPAGELAKLTDAAGSVWSWKYDQLGHQIEAVDPDSGTSVKKYNDRGQNTSVTDGRLKTVAYTYDNLSRQLESREGSSTGPLLTSQTWDPAGAQGKLASGTRYARIGGATYEYKNTFANYDALYRPGRTTLTVPSVPGQEALAGTYTTAGTYNLDGTQKTASYPAAGNLAAESLAYTYNDLRQVTGISSNLGGYLSGQTYTLTGKSLQTTLKAGGQDTWITDAYEYGTQRLASRRTDQYGIAQAVSAVTYGYDEAGNVKSISDVSRTGTETQCFRHDHLARVTEEFTSKTTQCPPSPGPADIGGPAAYWNSYTYNTDGTRKTETRHDLTGDSTRNGVRTYSYPAAGAKRPHALSGTSTTTGSAPAVLESYGYDDAGNTVTRSLKPAPGATSEQKLDWDFEGRLVKLEDKATHPTEGTATKTTEYVYAADGTRLVAHSKDNSDPNAERTTLYLGSTELTLRKGAAKPTATRYYQLGSATAVRGDDGAVSFQVSDHHNTGTVSVDAVSGAVDHRRTMPFGAPRGKEPTSWAGSKGFVGGTTDGTGLTHLGARQYDPSTGRFISPDPLLEPEKPQTLNGYGYAGNNPATFSDPTGMSFLDWALDLILSTPWWKLITQGRKIVNTIVSAARSVSSGKAHIQVTPGRQQCHYAMGMNQCSTVGKPQYKLVYGPPKAPEHQRSSSSSDGSGYPACKECMAQQGNPEVAKEILIALCGWVPVLGAGCDAYDVKRSADEGDAVGVTTGLVAFLPFGDLLKLGKQYKRLEDAFSACECFTAGTKVLLADGSSKNIEDIALGDEVRTTDPESGETGVRPVTKLITTETDRNFNELSLATDSGLERLTATHEHPFWSPSRGAWVDASALTAGMTLLTESGDTVLVTANRAFTQRAKTYNLTVDDLHTYFVFAGSTPVLVHNAKCKIGFSDDTVGDAFQGMNKGGGHAMRHLIKDGLLPNKGSVESQRKIFEEKFSPNLTNPDQTFDWKLGGNQAKGFAKTVDGKVVVLFVAKDGPYQGKIIGAFAPTPENIEKWGLN
ncbi:polymorphic toxin-type HINT domain-containing protein [Streptomyces yangpuensis]